MFARVTTFQVPADKIDEQIRIGREEVAPAARKIDGNEGIYVLVDRGSGKSLAITLWADEEAMRASEEAASQLRQQGADQTGESVISVERYEVVFP